MDNKDTRFFREAIRDVALISSLLVGNIFRGCYDEHQNTKLESMETKLKAVTGKEETNHGLPVRYEINGKEFYLRINDGRPVYTLIEE